MTPPPDSNGIAGGVEQWAVSSGSPVNPHVVTSPIVPGLCDVCRKPLAAHSMGGGVPMCPGIAYPTYRSTLNDALATTPDPTARTGEATRTAAAANIIDEMMGGKTNWRHWLDRSDFLESADWLTALRYADAAIRALPLPGDAS